MGGTLRPQLVLDSRPNRVVATSVSVVSYKNSSSPSFNQASTTEQQKKGLCDSLQTTQGGETMRRQSFFFAEHCFHSHSHLRCDRRRRHDFLLPRSQPRTLASRKAAPLSPSSCRGRTCLRFCPAREFPGVSGRRRRFLRFIPTKQKRVREGERETGRKIDVKSHCVTECLEQRSPHPSCRGQTKPCTAKLLVPQPNNVPYSSDFILLVVRQSTYKQERKIRGTHCVSHAQSSWLLPPHIRSQ